MCHIEALTQKKAVLFLPKIIFNNDTEKLKQIHTDSLNNY